MDVSPFALALEVIAFCAAGPGDRPDARRPNILLISLDSIRPDHLGCYGYPRPTSPHLDAFAEQAVLFRRAYSTSDWTLPAHASLLTGCLARTHGAVSPSPNTLSFSAGIPTLPGMLREMGYATQAVVSSSTLDRRFGFGRGFDVYDDRTVLALGEQAARLRGSEFSELSEILGDYTTAQAIRMLDHLAGDSRPFFLFVHYWDAHCYYKAIPPFRERFVRPYSGVLDARNMCDEFRRRAGELKPEDLRHAQDLYDAGIALTDDYAGRLLAEVERLGILDKTMVWVVSDHGDEFGEHGRFLHPHSLFEHQIRVIMMVRPPGRRPTAGPIDDLVSLADVAPTILDMIGAKPMPAAEGESLAALIDDPQTENAPHRRYIVAETVLRTAVVGRRYKLLAWKGNEDTWYDLSTDATEAKPLTEGPSELMPIFAEIARKRQAVKPVSPSTLFSRPEIPEALKDSLRSLGYVEGVGR
jgi:arylsulfatase A-like enzyme